MLLHVSVLHSFALLYIILVEICHSFLIHSVACYSFQCLGIMNKAGMNTLVQCSLNIYFHLSFFQIYLNF